MSTAIICWAALATYALSLVLPGFVTRSDDPSSANWLGYFILGIGWLGMFESQFAWYANLLFLAATIAARFKGPAAGAGLAALAFALGCKASRLTIFRSMKAEHAPPWSIISPADSKCGSSRSYCSRPIALSC